MRRGTVVGFARVGGGFVGSCLALNLARLGAAFGIRFARGSACWLPLALVASMIAENVGAIYLGCIARTRAQ